MATLIAARGHGQVAVTVRIRSGAPSERIAAFESKVQAELILLGASAASRASRLMARGVVHRVIGEAGVPVMTVRRTRAIIEEQLASARAVVADGQD